MKDGWSLPMVRQKTSSRSWTFWIPLTQPCRLSWCLYIMCICTLTPHSTRTAHRRAVDLCTQPFALENCVWSPVSLKALAFDSQTVDTDHQGALLTLLVPKCCPSSCQHVCSFKLLLCQLKTPLYLPVLIAWCFILLEMVWPVGLNDWHVLKGASQSPSITHTSTFQSFSYKSWHQNVSSTS